MADTVYNVVEYALEDGSTVTLKPATIKTMRKFNEVFMQGPKGTDKPNQSMAEAEDAGMDWILSMAVLLLNKQRPELTVEEAEDLMDMETAYKVIELCAGMKLNDPKLLERATEALNKE